MPLTSSMEDYLEAVLVLQQQKGYARCVDVAEFLNVKKPSVSRAVKELSKKKCLLKKDDGTLSLTEQGWQIAQQIYEKHQFFTRQLIEAGLRKIKVNGTERMSFPNVNRQSPPKDTRHTYSRKTGVCENTLHLLIAQRQTAKTIFDSKRTLI